jgi:hypothetical protein
VRSETTRGEVEVSFCRRMNPEAPAEVDQGCPRPATNHPCSWYVATTSWSTQCWNGYPDLLSCLSTSSCFDIAASSIGHLRSAALEMTSNRVSELTRRFDASDRRRRGGAEAILRKRV